jgi:hypothetical protein
MPPLKPLLATLAILLMMTGVKTRPVELANERFERSKPPVMQVLTQAL